MSPSVSKADTIDVKPYDKSIIEPSHPSEPKKQRSEKSRPWTGEELVQLLLLVERHGYQNRKALEGVIPGRTGNQAYLAWV